jgi:hypothetical protein
VTLRTRVVVAPPSVRKLAGRWTRQAVTWEGLRLAPVASAAAGVMVAWTRARHRSRPQLCAARCAGQD